MANMASTYRKQGRWKEAEELDAQVMGMKKRVLGTEHPDTLTSMNNLAYTWKGQDRGEEAVALMRECLQLRERVLGTEHPLTSSSRTTLMTWENGESGVGVLRAYSDDTSDSPIQPHLLPHTRDIKEPR